MAIDAKTAIAYLGYRAEDKVTGYSGVITSICFDLYGCVQATLNTGFDKDNKMREQYWFDINRLTVRKDQDRVMDLPDFIGTMQVADKGPAAKPPSRAV